MKRYRIECSTQDYTRPLDNEALIIHIDENSGYEALKIARNKYRKYKDFRILKIEKI